MESKNTWQGEVTFEITANNKENEQRVHVFPRMETEGCYMKFITPCFVENNYAHDAVADLDYSRSLISKELMKKLRVSIEEKEDGRKEVTKRLLVQMNRDIFFVEFDVNPSDNE